MNTIRFSRFLRTLICTWVASTVLASAMADTYDWNGSTTGGATGASNTWDTATANWTGFGTVWPAVSTGNDDAAFGGTAGTVTIAAGGVTANDLSFTTTGYTVTASTLTLNGTTPTITVGSGLTATINSQVSGGAGLLKSGTGTLTLGGSTNNFTGNIVISQGTLAANHGSAMGSTANTITLGDASTGSNPVVFKVDAGIAAPVTVGSVTTSNFGTSQTILLNSGSALGANAQALVSTINLAGTVPLTIQATNTGGHSTAQDWNGQIIGTGIATGSTALTLDGTSTGLRLTFGGPSLTAANTFTGDVVIKGNVATQNTTFSGGAGNAARQNLGFLNNNVNVNPSTTWTLVWGGETVQALDGSGNISLSNQNALNNIGLTIGNNNTGGTYSGAISGGFGIAKVGTGTQVLSGANGYSGATAIRNGVLQLTSGSNRLPTGTTVTLGNLTDSGKLTLGNSSAAVNQTVAGLLTSGTGTANAVVGGNASTSILTINNATSNAFGGLLGGAGTNENNLALIKSGVGTLTLTGLNTFTGNTAGPDFTGIRITAGTVSTDKVALNNNPSGIGGGSASIGLSGGTFQYTGPTATIQRRIELGTPAGNAIDASGTGALTWDNTGGMGTAGVGGNRTLTLTGTSTAANTMGVALNSSVALIKSGTGTWFLSGNNSYTLGTTVSQGKLSASGGNNPLSTGAIVLGDANTGANTVTLSFDKLTSSPTLNTVTVANFGNGTTIRGTENPSGTNNSPNFPLVLNKAVTLQVGESTGASFSSDLIFQSISGAGAGAGNDSILINANNGSNRTLRTSITNVGTASTFTGNVRVTQGRWQMQNRSYVANTAGNQNLIIPDTSSVTLDSGTTWSITHGVETIDALNGSGTVNLGGGSYLPGAAQLTVGAGNTVGNFSGVLQSMTLEKTGTATQTLGGTVDNNSLAVIVTNGMLVLGKSSSGSVHAVGSGTTINGGTLQLGGTGGDQIFNNSNVTANGGIFDLNGNNETINTLILAGGTVSGAGTLTSGAAINAQSGTASSNLAGSVGLNKTTVGTVTLGGVNSYTGATSVTAGLLLVNGSHTGGAAYTVGGSGTLGGTGSTASSIILNSGGKLSPGASIESFATGSNDWNADSLFNFEFSTDGTGTAGTNWDLLSITGSLDLTDLAPGGDELVLNLITMADASNSGLLSSWNPNANHIWSGFVTTTTGITAYAANRFSINTSAFQNPINGTFSVVQNGNNLDLVYVAVPEPGSLAMLLFGGVIFFLFRGQRQVR